MPPDEHQPEVISDTDGSHSDGREDLGSLDRSNEPHRPEPEESDTSEKHYPVENAAAGIRQAKRLAAECVLCGKKLVYHRRQYDPATQTAYYYCPGSSTKAVEARA